MKTEMHGPYDQMNVEAKVTSVTTLVAEGQEALDQLHKSLDILTQRLEALLNRIDVDGETGSDDVRSPSSSLMCNELITLNGGIDSACRRVNMLMSRLEL